MKRSMKWLVDFGLNVPPQLRSYGDGTSVYSLIRKTGEVWDRMEERCYLQLINLKKGKTSNFTKFDENAIAYEPRREKTGLRGFRPDLTQIGLCR